jgi:hypothetical protein
MSKPSQDVMRLPIEQRAEIAFKAAVAKAINERSPGFADLHLAQQESSKTGAEGSTCPLKI